LSLTVEMVLADLGPENLEATDRRARDGRYLSGNDLALVIEANPGRPLPDGLRDYLCRFLRGTIKQKRGPKREDRYFNKTVESLAADFYRSVLEELQKSPRPRGRDAIAEGLDPAHREAAQRVKEQFPVRFGKMSLERIANIFSASRATARRRPSRK
jgi:hypothetical protein